MPLVLVTGAGAKGSASTTGLLRLGTLLLQLRAGVRKDPIDQMAPISRPRRYIQFLATHVTQREGSCGPQLASHDRLNIFIVHFPFDMKVFAAAQALEANG